MIQNAKKLVLIERFIKLIEDFAPRHQGHDQFWTFLLREKRSWVKVRVQKYEKTYYIAPNGSDPIAYPDPRYDEPLEFRGRLKHWIEKLTLWRKGLSRDPIAAQAKLIKSMPLSLRWGVIQRQNIRELLPHWLPIEKELTVNEIEETLALLDKPDPYPQSTMSLHRFLEYCRVAYQANPKTLSDFRPGLSGREYYARYADGRDGGLLKIEDNSPESFVRWYDSKERQGCHPWEVYRGGNSTHIDLGVVQAEKGGWSIYLDAFSSTRLVETCRIALALNKASLPFTFCNKESYKARLLAEDWVGVVPEGASLSFAWQEFPKEWKVADAIHICWIFDENPGRRAALRNQLRQIVYWLPEDISNVVRKSRRAPTRSRNEASCVNFAGDLVGSFRSGRRDLSTNKKLLADAIASNLRRGRKHHR